MLSASARWLARSSSRSHRVSSAPGAFTSFSTAPLNNEDKPWSVPEALPTEGEWAGCRKDFMAPITISKRGASILHDPLYNKGTAFKSGERDRLRFRGLLPHRAMNISKQKTRFLKSLRDLDSNIRKNLLLEDLHDRNETLYHRVLVDHIEGKKKMTKSSLPAVKECLTQKL